MRVDFFTTGPACTLCARVLPRLRDTCIRLGLPLRIVDLRDTPAPEPDYVFRAPVVHLEGVRIAEGRVDLPRLEAQIERAARKREGRAGQGGGER